jgi:ligand-binding SRPBCC domain-containing protein
MGRLYYLRREQWIPRPIEEVFDYFCDARNLETITPPWLKFRVLTPGPVEMKPGTEIRYRLSWWFIRIPWKTVIRQWQPPHYFMDEQAMGPYRRWEHTHSFRSEKGGTRMFDSVRYELPFGWLGAIAHSLRVRRDLEKIFDYRAESIGKRFAPDHSPAP